MHPQTTRVYIGHQTTVKKARTIAFQSVAKVVKNGKERKPT